jgi:hypothetical protein
VLVGQIEPQESLSRDVEHMNPHEVMAHPACGRVLEALAFLVRQGRSVVLEGMAEAVLAGRIDESADRHHHQQGHDALGLFEREGRGQTLWGFEEATPTFRPGLPFIAVAPRLGGSLALVQFVRREEKTALLVEACPTVCAPRRQGPRHRVDALLGLRPGAGAPPLAIVGRGVDGAGVEKRGLPACPKTGERLRGLCGTSNRGPAQRLAGLDFLGTLLTPRRINGTRGLRLALFRGDQAPAWRHLAGARAHDRLAIACSPRGHGRRLCLGQALLGLAPGRRDPGEPLAAGLGQLVQVLGALQGTSSHQIHGAGGGLERRHVVADDLAERLALVPMATQGGHPHGDTGLGLHDQRPHPLVEVGAMVPTLALGDGHALCVRSLSAVLPAINMDTRRLARAARGRQPQTLGRRGGKEAAEGRQPSRV